MKKVVIPVAVVLGLLLLGSTSLAVSPGKLWWTEYTSDVFTWSAEGTYTYMFEGSDGSAVWYTVEVAADAPLYRGTVLLRYESIRARTDEPGLNCKAIDQPRVHPDQPVRFHIGWRTDETMSHHDAEELFDGLSYTVLTDGGPQYSWELEQQAIHPYFEETDWDKAFCPWTVRP